MGLWIRNQFLEQDREIWSYAKAHYGGCNSRSYGYRRYGAQPCIGQRGWFSRYELVQHKVKIAWILVILMAVGIVGSFFGVFAI